MNNLTVSIIGTGLIGGSIALAIKKAHRNATLIGYDISQQELKKAKKTGVIDQIAPTLQQACGSDLILFATPVEETKRLLTQAVQFPIKNTAIITDVGSTKQAIVNHAIPLFESESKPTFIGGHPMSGSHKNGVESAKAHLFENAYYILTPMDNTPMEKVTQLKNWLSGTGSHFVTMTPAEHDYATAVVSHFPHLIACGLVRHVEKYAKKMPIIAELAAGGFKDITRIASSHPKMRSDIVAQNMDNLLILLEDWDTTLSELKAGVTTHAFDYFETTKKYRDSIPQRKTGAIQAYNDIFVDLVDQTGALATVTGLLADNHINITNLEILEIREGILGVLHVIFANEKDRGEAKAVLIKAGYKVYEAL